MAPVGKALALHVLVLRCCCVVLGPVPIEALQERYMAKVLVQCAGLLGALGRCGPYVGHLQEVTIHGWGATRNATDGDLAVWRLSSAAQVPTQGR